MSQHKAPLVSLSSAESLRNPAHRTCIHSWSRGEFVSGIHFFSDGTLRQEDVESLGGANLSAVPAAACEELVQTELKNRPHLMAMRERSVMYRKIIDIPLWFRNEPKVVYADTDIFFVKRLALPAQSVDVAMGVDDATSYSGSWRIATEQHALPGLNAGFLLYRPAAIDFDFLEFLAGRYFAQCQTPWLAEQPIWAILMSRLTETALWDGRDVRVIGALQKRTRQQILANRFVWLKQGKIATEESQVAPLIEGTAVAHMAGVGKRWIHLCERYACDEDGSHELRLSSKPEPTFSLRMLTAGRIAMTEGIAAWQRRER